MTTPLSQGAETPRIDAKPIYLTESEAQQPFDEIVASVRSELTGIRGKLHDLERMYPAWRERVDFAAGGITCVISALYSGQKEYHAFRTKPHAAPAVAKKEYTHHE